MKISDYRLIKICYDQNLKDFESSMLKLTKEEFECVSKIAEENINLTIRKRNIIVDWIWITKKDLDSTISIMEKYGMRCKTIDHTETYYLYPEKLPVLRKELDEWMSKFLDIDLILDRIGEVGIDKITKLEKKFLKENFNKV